MKSESLLVQTGWLYECDTETAKVRRIAVMERVVTDWKRKTCGVEPQAGFRDENCIGCVHDGDTTLHGDGDGLPLPTR